MKKENNIWALSAKYLSGEMNAEEELKFQVSLSKDPNLKLEFENIEKTWGNLAKNKTEETSDSWNNLHSRLEEDGLLEQEDVNYRSRFYFLSRAAAVILILLAFGFTARYISSDNAHPFSNLTHFEAVENVSSYTLPDGSRVFLNKGSHLSYSDDFGENRKIQLKGEGFFEVVSDLQHPFEIKTQNAYVKVLGTSFNVKETSESTEILVESGKVQLVKDQDSKGIFLLRGEFGKSTGKVELKETNTDVNYLSWKTREFQFSDQNLNEVFEVLAKSYHIEIKILDSEINNFKINSSYKQQSIDAILKTVCTAFDLKCEKKENNYTFSLNNS